MNINSTESSTYTNAAYSSKGFSGMASGIDTESLVQSMLSSLQSKIDKQNQAKQVLTWKQEFYRDIIKDVNSFQAKFLDLTSKTSLRLNTFFDSIKASSSSSAVNVSSESGAVDTEFKMQVARLATASSVTSQSAGSGEIQLSATGNALSFKYDRSVSIKIGDADAVSVDLEGVTSAEEVRDRINAAAGAGFAELKYAKVYKDDSNNVLTKKADGKYYKEDGTEYTGNVTEENGDAIGLKFAKNAEFEISGSSAGMAILGLSGTVKSTAAKDDDGNEIPGQFVTESNAVNKQFAEIGKVNGSVDVTLDGVTKSIAIAENESMDDFKAKVQSAFGSSVKFENDNGKWNISVEGKGRNITISANADTMEAIGFEKGTTVVSNQTLRSDKVGNLIGADVSDSTTEYSFKVNGKEIKYTAADSIASIMNKVNSSDAGVKMTYNDLNNTFKIEAASTGAGYDVKIEGDTENLFGGLGFAMNGDSLDQSSVKAGQNAVVNIDGTTVERANNNFTYNGISITLKSTTGEYALKNDGSGDFEVNADGTLQTAAGKTENVVEVKTSRNTDKIMDALKSFVEDYNTMIEKLNKLTHEKATYKKYPPLTEAQKKQMSEKEIELWEEKSKEGLLRNDNDISRFLSTMRSALYSSNDSGIILANIGIDSSSNWQDFGKLSIDEDKLKEALETNSDAVRKLFAGDNGLAKKLSKACDDLANTSSGRPGALVSKAGVVGKGTEKSNEIQTKLDSITKKLNSLNMLYEKRKDRYWKQFNAMEKALSNTDSQSSWLSNFTAY